MGNKAGGESMKSKKLSMNLEKANKAEAGKVKLLLLGAGESGKSTLFKQMRVIYGSGYTEEERAKLRPFLLGNLIEGAIDIFNAAPTVGISLDDPAAVSAGKLLSGLADKRVLSEDVADAIQTLWADEQFKDVWAQRSRFQVQDTWCEFAEKLREFPAWGGPDWVPTMDDIFKSRVRTTGVVDELFMVRGIKLRMLDVGGQRNERRKWIHCFEGVTSVIFVVSLSEYDQMLFEDTSKNRLVEALELFKEICNSAWFKDSAVILFLNKTDLFHDKYVEKRVPINASGLFPSAPSGEPDEEAALAWFEQMFRDQCEDPNKPIYAYFTCATDTHQVDAVMKASAQHILKKNLAGSGVLV